jgi:ATP-dependent exoDNAse (exonuclease V) alpha subunit
MEAEHHPVLVLAPGTQAVQETLRKGAFPNAQTVEQLLVNEKLQEEFRNGVWWVDEAGQLSARSMHRLFELAQKQNARIVLSGDVGQHRAVERGDAMRSLYEHADLKPAYVTKIQRQSGNYRENIELLSQGRVVEAFRKMDGDGCIHEMPFHERYKAIAELYVQSANEGARPLVVAPTHEEGRMVTQEIRAKLKADGELKQERPIDVLKEIDMSPAERADWRTYRPGWIIELMRATPGTQAGTRMVIDSIDYSSGDIYVKKPDGATRRWDVQEYVDRFQVYQSDSVELAPGDRIRITKNGRAEYGKSKVFNGSLHTLKGFDEHGDLKLDNGMVIHREYAHLNYGYATTSHAAQSKTVNHVIVAESAVSFAAGSREQFYVSTSRGRKRLDVFTNNKAELLEAVEPSSQRRSAMELVAATSDEKPLPEDYREELRRAQERAELKLAHKSEPAKARKKDKQPLRESLGAQREPSMPRQEKAPAKLLKATPPDLSQPPAMTKAKVHEKEIEPEIEPDMEP